MERSIKNTPLNKEAAFNKSIDEKVELKLRAQKNRGSVWMGLGLFGMVGWSVAVPALFGTALGVWLDRKLPQHFSWTLSGLLTGLIAGCLIAWNWIQKEHSAIHKNTTENDD